MSRISTTGLGPVAPAPSVPTRATLAGLVLSVALGVGGLVAASVTSAAEARVGLGIAETFAVLAGTGVTNTGPTVVNGDLGTCPTPAITGAPAVNGTIYANGLACDAQRDLVIAYDDAAGRAIGTPYAGPTDLGGRILKAGVYNSPSSLAITGTLILDAENNPDAVFIFQAGSTLITATNSRVELINLANPCNVFWQVGSDAVLEVGSTFMGTILALTSISAKTRATVEGRLLARNAAVTLDSNVITASLCEPTGTTTTTPTDTTTTLPPDAVTAPGDTGSTSTTLPTGTTSPTDAATPARGTGLTSTTPPTNAAVAVRGTASTTTSLSAGTANTAGGGGVGTRATTVGPGGGTASGGSTSNPGGSRTLPTTGPAMEWAQLVASAALGMAMGSLMLVLARRAD